MLMVFLTAILALSILTDFTCRINNVLVFNCTFWKLLSSEPVILTEPAECSSYMYNIYIYIHSIHESNQSVLQTYGNLSPSFIII